MNPPESPDLIPLTRDCEVTLIPYGAKVTLKAGDTVRITQALGDTYTLYANGSLVRLEGKDADAIGKQTSQKSPTEAQLNHSGPANEKEIWNQMRTCYDPEIPVNIVDLGLIYNCKITPLETGGSKVEVQMTLTAPGCGMGDTIRNDVRNKILSVPGVRDAQVDLVWEPHWNQSMISEAAKLQLGLL